MKRCNFYDIFCLKDVMGMKWLDRLEDCLRYIEDNMKSEIDMDVLARKACLSKFYFYRMFLYVTGIQVNEYIRNRRMTMAAKELGETKAKIIDVAMDYGYSTSESFSRAFKAIHGISPSEAKNPNCMLKAYPPISFQIRIKGEVPMNYKIVEKEGFNVIGVSRKFSTENGANFREIPKFWTEFNSSGLHDKLLAYSAKEEIYGICMNYDRDEEEFDYVIAVEYNGKSGIRDFEVRKIPASTYAVFTDIKMSEIQDFTRRIFNEWLPATEYELTDSPEIECYPYGDINSDKYRMQIWMPIKK